jgi:hypothetical protein
MPSQPIHCDSSERVHNDESRAQLFAALLVDGAGGDLLGPVRGLAALLLGLLHVLVLALVLVAPGILWHGGAPFRS